MEYPSAILFLLAGIGVINGLLVGTYYLFRREGHAADVYLGGLILMLCFRIGKSIFYYFDNTVDKLVLQIGLSACAFIGPLFYLYVRSQLSKRPGGNTYGQLGLGLLLLIVFGVGVMFPYRQYPDWWNAYFIYGIYAIWAVFVVAGLWEARPTVLHFFRDKQARTSSSRLLMGVVAGVIFITLTYMFALFFRGFTYIWGALIFTAAFYYLLGLEITSRLRKKGIYRKREVGALPGDRDKLKRVGERVEAGKLYRNPKLKLADLATVVGMRPHELSRLLNEGYPHGFAQYVNEYRVREAQRLIGEREDLSLEGIGYESGFNSKSSFFAVFKRLTQYTPAQYKKMVAREEYLRQ